MHNETFDRAALFGAELRRRMKNQGVTQDQLADRVGVTQVTISRHLAGRHDTPIGLMHRICAALGTTIAEVDNAVNSRYRHVAA